MASLKSELPVREIIYHTWPGWWEMTAGKAGGDWKIRPVVTSCTCQFSSAGRPSLCDLQKQACFIGHGQMISLQNTSPQSAACCQAKAKSASDDSQKKKGRNEMSPDGCSASRQGWHVFRIYRFKKCLLLPAPRQQFMYYYRIIRTYLTSWILSLVDRRQHTMRHSHQKYLF